MRIAIPLTVAAFLSGFAFASLFHRYIEGPATPRVCISAIGPVDAQGRGDTTPAVVCNR